MDTLFYLVSALGLVFPSVDSVANNNNGGDLILSKKDNVRPQDKMLLLLNKTMEASRNYPRCSSPDSMSCLDVTKKIKGYKVIIHSCPTVGKLHLQLTTPGHFKRTRHGSLKTKAGRRELVITRPRRHQTIWVSSRDGSERKNGRPGLIWRYKALTKRSNGTVWRKGAECSSKMNLRRKRSSYNIGDNSVMNDLKSCGTEQSCVRFGPKGCRHMGCEYLLTYKIANRTLLQLEISGKTNGWVALGLSSDDKMGGDDVIVCKRRRTESDELVARSMTTKVAHSKPKLHKVNDLKLEYSRIDGSYIYCKMSKSLKNGVSTNDAKVDLTNNWYQLYAMGDIHNNGFMLKHNKIPPTSLETVSMLRHFQINSLKYEKLTNSASHSLLHHSLGIAFMFSVILTPLLKII